MAEYLPIFFDIHLTFSLKKTLSVFGRVKVKFVRLYNIFDAHSFLLLQLCGINVDSNLLVQMFWCLSM